MLLLFTDPHYLVNPVYPFGLDMIAGQLRAHGYAAELDFPFLPTADLETNLRGILARSDPDLIGLGIRNIDTAMSCEPSGNFSGPGYQARYFLPEIREVVRTLKKLAPDLPVIAGGGAFSIAPAAMLAYLGLEYGIRGPGGDPLLRFIEAFPDWEAIRKVPGLVAPDGDRVVDNPPQTSGAQGLGGLDRRSPRFAYSHESLGMPVLTRRGCNQGCTYCVEPLIEGRCLTFRTVEDILTELERIAERHPAVGSIFFADTEFNVPDFAHAERLAAALLASGLNRHFRFSSQFLPKAFNRTRAERLAEAGFSVILTLDSFADPVLKANGASYRQTDIVHALECCETAGLEYRVNLVFGLPGETRSTLDHSLSMMRKFPFTAEGRYEYTIGGRIYHGTPLCRWALKNAPRDRLFGRPSTGFLEPYFYCAPWDPLRVKDHVENALSAMHPPEAHHERPGRETLAVAFLADQQRWDAAVKTFTGCGIEAAADVYDYFLKKLSAAGELEKANVVSRHLLATVSLPEHRERYPDLIPLIRYYLSLLESVPVRDEDF